MIDWEVFLNKILDGAFAVDIRKTGSAVMFARNQLGRQENKNTEASRFRKTLQELIEKREFSVSESLRFTETYLTIMDLGIAFSGGMDFLPKKCASLFVHLSEFKGQLNEKSRQDRHNLRVKCCFTIVKFIESWKNQYEIIGEKPIYGRHGFLENISNRWIAELPAAEPLQNPNILIGLIYLNEWDSLRKKDKEAFFQHNIINDNLFGAALYDMQRVNGNKINNLYKYLDFIIDCRLYHKEFYDIIAHRNPSWLNVDEAKSAGGADTGIANDRDEYDNYTKSMVKDGWLDKGNFNTPIPPKKDDDQD